MDSPQTYIVDAEAKRARLVRTIQLLPLDGLIWDVTIKQWRPRRSLESNRRLWALHKLAADSTGHSTSDMHEFCLQKFLPRNVVKVGLKEVEVAGRSSKLDKKQFSEFMERVEEFYISELGVFLGDR